MMPFQILVVIGLFFEFASVFLTASQAFYPLGKKERKMKYIEDKGQTLDTYLEKRRRMGILTVILLSLGMLLQGLAVFVD